MEQVQAAIPTEENNLEELVEKQGQLAAAMLQQNGYAILKELGAVIREMILVTQVFTVPVITNIDKLKTDLGEKADGFFAEFDELKAEIQDAIKAYSVCAAIHDGKDEGEVTADDLDGVIRATTGYSTLQNVFEENIMPKIGTLSEQLNDFGVDIDTLLNIPE